MLFLINDYWPNSIKRLERKLIISKYKYGIDSPKTINIILKLERKKKGQEVRPAQ